MIRLRWFQIFIEIILIKDKKKKNKGYIKHFNKKTQRIFIKDFVFVLITR
jgi:hypothetical protein